MILLGVNSVLFKDFSYAEAAQAIAACGYDGIEISAIKGMCEHLVLDEWESQKDEIIEATNAAGLRILSAEVASQDPERLEKAFGAAKAIGIPVINVGPGGKSDDEEEFEKSIASLTALAKRAEHYGVTLCCKAHVGGSIYSTPTTLRAMELITSPAFGVDMDPSHIHRAGEKPEEALGSVLSRMKHIHIRDCKGLGPSPGTPAEQACGRGDINLYGYFEEMVKAKYNGPVCLEVIGPALSMTDATRVAAESYGYMNACLKKLGAR